MYHAEQNLSFILMSRISYHCLYFHYCLYEIMLPDPEEMLVYYKPTCFQKDICRAVLELLDAGSGSMCQWQKGDTAIYKVTVAVCKLSSGTHVCIDYSLCGLYRDPVVPWLSVRLF